MDDAVKKYRERRDERIKAKKARVDDQWITMRGTHVLIDDGGQVSKGPEKLKYVVKQGGGYKSRNERKYGNTDKYSKFLNGGWNASNGNRDPNAFHKSEVVHEPSQEDLKKLEKTYKSKHRRSKGYLDPKPEASIKTESSEPQNKKPVWTLPSMKKMNEYVKEYTKMGVPMEKALATLYENRSDVDKAIKALKDSAGKDTGGRSKLTKRGTRSMKHTAGDISMKDFRQEVKKLIDKKGIDGLKNQDYLDMKDKYGIDVSDWQNAVGYWRYGAGKRKL